MSESSSTNTTSRTPTYFLGIGGPSFIDDMKHPARAKLAALGEEITTKVKPKAVVVFSAHWQGSPNKVLINVAEKPDLIYDFYGFPKHYYEYDYPNRGSPEIASKVIEKLTDAGIEVEGVDRGLDHGVWAGFMAAFDPIKNPLNVPVIQVSLFDNEDPDEHYRLGQALQTLRDEGIVIVGAGMVVHNQPDFRVTRETGKTMPYVFTFDGALKDATTGNPEERQANMAAVLQRDDARKANPSFEHVLPVHIAAGAAGADVGEQVWTHPDGSLSWAQYRFGKAPEA